jgi:hypothetical protein
MRTFLRLPLLLMLLLQPTPTVGLPGGPPVAGWSTWNTFACSINATLVKQGADHLVSSGLLAAGYNYIVSVCARSAVYMLTLCHCAPLPPLPPPPPPLPLPLPLPLLLLLIHG